MRVVRVVRAPQIHLKNRELENTKLSAELQMLKSVDVNKENIIAQFKEEVLRLQTCLMEKEEQYREVLAKVSPLVRKITFLASEQHHSKSLTVGLGLLFYQRRS